MDGSKSEREKQMKKITVQSKFHNTEATFFVPEYVEDSLDAMIWIEGEAYREESQLYYGPARAKYARIKRALCGVSECRCYAAVKKEIF